MGNWIRPIDPYGWFQWYFSYWKGRRSEDDIRQIGRWKRIVSRFTGILNKLISKNKDSKRIRQILLQWCYELSWANHQLCKVWFSSTQ